MITSLRWYLYSLISNELQKRCTLPKLHTTELWSCTSQTKVEYDTPYTHWIAWAAVTPAESKKEDPLLLDYKS